MNRYDLAIDDPGTDSARLKVTRSGDVDVAVSVASVSQRAMLAAATSRGQLLHRPDFGAGAERMAGLPATVAAARFAAAWRRSLLDDDRVTAVAVEATVEPTRTVVSASVSTRADIPMTISYEV